MPGVLDARLNSGFANHPKTLKLHRRLGDAGCFRLVCLILWAAANKPDGDLGGMSAEDIEIAAGWSGEPEKLVDTLADLRFLDGEPGHFRLHDWEEHQPWATGAEARSEKAKWAALCKKHGREAAARMMPEYAERMHPASCESATSTGNPAASSATGMLSALLDAATSMPQSPVGKAGQISRAPREQGE